MIFEQISLDKEYTNEELKRFLYKTIKDLNIYIQSKEKEECTNNG